MLEARMKRLAIAMAIGSGVACGGGSGPTAPTSPPANVVGAYNATITASSACSATLPAAAWAVNFASNIAQTGAAVQVQLFQHVGMNTVSGTVSGQTINFPSMSLSGTTGAGAVTVVATGTASVDANGDIAGTLSGTYQLAGGTTCNGTHQIQWKKAGAVPFTPPAGQ
jgi:hypothetical protein